MAVEYWLINGKEKLRLPVNPESNAYSSLFGYEETEVEGLGEITTIKRRGLKDFSISTFWPADYNPTYCGYNGFITPDTFIKKIEAWRNKRQPIRYTVTGAAGVNVAVTIREFQIEAERAGSPGDVYFTLALKEWRDVEVKKVDTAKTSATKATTKKRPTTAKKETPKTYTVKKNDSLSVISKRIYGDGTIWRKIYDANKKVIGKNPNNIKVGQKLVIPK